MCAPSSSIIEGATDLSSATSSSEKRSRGNATSEYSRMSVMRPTRSWCLTSQYFCLTRARSVSFDAAIRS